MNGKHDRCAYVCPFLSSSSINSRMFVELKNHLKKIQTLKKNGHPWGSLKNVSPFGSAVWLLYRYTKIYVY